MSKKIKGNLKSKTFWANALTVVGGVVAYLAASPEIVAAYGPQAVIAVGVVNIILRQVTSKPVDEK